MWRLLSTGMTSDAGRKMIDELVMLENLTELTAETDRDAVEFYRSYGFEIQSPGEKYSRVQRFLCRLLFSQREETVHKNESHGGGIHSMALKFRTMDAILDRKHFVNFRKDAFLVSFGYEDNFDEQAYADLIAARTQEFPEGYVMLEDDGRIVGQIEMHPRDFGDKRIGFVSLFYLVPEMRGNVYGKQLTNYAEDVFRRHGLGEYHLRVSPTSEFAVRLYEKCGLGKIREEQHQHVMWRMGKHI